MNHRLLDIFTKLAYRPGGWVIIVVFWGILASLSYGWQYSRLEADAIEMATLRGRLVFSMVQITRSWNATHGGVYAAITPESPANPYLEHPDKFAQTDKGKALSLINPAYMTRQINELMGRQTDLKIHLTSLKPINPANAADAWENKSLQSFEGGAKEQLILQGEGKQAVFRYMAPLFIEQSCLKCHAKQGYKLGQVRGGLSVSQPASYITDIIDSQKLSISLIHFTAFVLLSLISIFSLWQNRRQILSLEQARDQRRQAADVLALKVSELEETRDYLVQSEKHASLGRMVAGFAHEINTPVGIALSAISQNDETIAQLHLMLKMDEVREEDIEHHLDTLSQADKLAISNLRRAADLVRSFKRTSIDQSSDQARKFNMRELLDDVLATLHSQFKRTRIKIELNCPKDIVIYGIPGLLEQLFTNLLMNSLQHGFTQGQRAGAITITIQQQPDNKIAICYCDDGVGMPNEVKNNAFEPFFTTARGKGGSGLGLYVCYNIVANQLGGAISISSEPSEGCCFNINFPVQLKVES
ncbi:MAG: DUF3365 domain-containing protein [Nitrosomonadales bacterium]